MVNERYFMRSGINKHIFWCFPVKIFFILIWVIAIMVPVSADPLSPNTQPERPSLTLLDNSSTSVPNIVVNPGTIIPRGQNAGKKVPGVIVVPVKKEQNTLRISNGQSYNKIGNIQIMKGPVPKTPKSTEISINTSNNLPTIEILDQNDKVLYSENFGYQNLMTVPMKMPGLADDQVPPVISTGSETTVVLPYMEGGRKIRIVDENGQAGDVVALEGSQILDQVTGTLGDLPEPPPANPGSFNVLILASGYTPANMNNFIYRAGLVENVIRQSEPFISKSSSIAFNVYSNTEDVGCYPGCNGIDRLMCCDGAKVVSAAEDSGALFDEIIVIHNTATYAGGGYRSVDDYTTNSYSSYCAVYDGSYTVSWPFTSLAIALGTCATSTPMDLEVTRIPLA